MVKQASQAEHECALRRRWGHGLLRCSAGGMERERLDERYFCSKKWREVRRE